VRFNPSGFLDNLKRTGEVDFVWKMDAGTGDCPYETGHQSRGVRPFAWGLEFITGHVNGDDPRAVLARHTEQAMAASEQFYELPDIPDYKLEDQVLTWTSAVKTPSPENNVARARLFTPRRERKKKPRAAILVLPQWNAQPDSHVEACRIFNSLGITALRLTLPYHEERRPAELERAEHLVSSNIGRTIQSMRQAVHRRARRGTMAEATWALNELACSEPAWDRVPRS
jgi:hypothetical protein